MGRKVSCRCYQDVRSGRLFPQPFILAKGGFNGLDGVKVAVFS
jgi:hypothetical protein